MIYNCDITEKDGKFIAQFPDMTNVLTYGSSLEEARALPDKLYDLLKKELGI